MKKFLIAASIVMSSCAMANLSVAAPVNNTFMEEQKQHIRDAYNAYEDAEQTGGKCIDGMESGVDVKDYCDQFIAKVRKADHSIQKLSSDDSEIMTEFDFSESIKLFVYFAIYPYVVMSAANYISRS